MLLISWVGKWNEKLYIYKVEYVFIQWFTHRYIQVKYFLPNIVVMENILQTISMWINNGRGPHTKND
jgi:hypothetical protein